MIDTRRLNHSGNAMHSPPQLILASSSVYRCALMDKLQLNYTSLAPEIDETPLSAELPASLVRRLAQEKARSVADRNPGAIVIGSDQVACCQGQAVGKPGTHEAAQQQLESLSGKQVDFLTGLCVMNPARGTCHLAVESCRVVFRALSSDQIESYLLKDTPLHCAGAFKAEGLGIALIHSIDTEDPNILVGLPLIRLIDFLALEGIQVLEHRV